MTKQTYRLFDLFIFTIIACVVESVNIFIFNFFKMNIGQYSFSQVYTLSFALVLGMIAIYRWNYYGLVVAPISGLVSVFVRSILQQEVTVNLYLAHTVGNLGLAICLLFFYKRDKKQMREHLGMMYIYYLSGFLTVEVVRSLCQIGSANYWSLLLNYVAFDLLNLVFGAVVFFIALKQKDFVVDMNTYLSEMNELSSVLSGQPIVSKNKNIVVEEIAQQGEVNEAALLDGGVVSNEQLKKLAEYRKSLEKRDSVFDEENKELQEYRKSKEASRHGRS